MATEGTQSRYSSGLTASADLSTHQFKFVKMSGNRTVTVCAAVTDIPCGVLQNDPASGEAAIVAYAGETKVQADETLAVADLIGTSTDGQAAVVAAGTDLTVYIAGQVIEGVTNAGEYATAVISCAAPARGQ
jgi:hypothetical protein